MKSIDTPQHCYPTWIANSDVWKSQTNTWNYSWWKWREAWDTYWNASLICFVELNIHMKLRTNQQLIMWRYYQLLNHLNCLNPQWCKEAHWNQNLCEAKVTQWSFETLLSWTSECIHKLTLNMWSNETPPILDPLIYTQTDPHDVKLWNTLLNH